MIYSLVATCPICVPCAFFSRCDPTRLLYALYVRDPFVAVCLAMGESFKSSQHCKSSGELSVVYHPAESDSETLGEEQYVCSQVGAFLFIFLFFCP